MKVSYKGENMRQETIVKTYLTFDELNDKQKEKVLDEYRYINVDDFEWYDYIQDDFHKILELFGFYDIESEFSGFWMQGDGARFTAKYIVPNGYTELKDRLNKILDYAPNYFVNAKDIKGLYLTLNFDNEIVDNIEYIDVYTQGNYSHGCTMFCDHLYLQEFARYLAAKYYIMLESEYEYLTSNESIEETLIANEFEFDIDTLK